MEDYISVTGFQKFELFKNIFILIETQGIDEHNYLRGKRKFSQAYFKHMVWEYEKDNKLTELNKHKTDLNKLTTLTRDQIRDIKKRDLSKSINNNYEKYKNGEEVYPEEDTLKRTFEIFIKRNSKVNERFKNVDWEYVSDIVLDTNVEKFSNFIKMFQIIEEQEEVKKISETLLKSEFFERSLLNPISNKEDEDIPNDVIVHLDRNYWKKLKEDFQTKKNTILRRYYFDSESLFTHHVVSLRNFGQVII